MATVTFEYDGWIAEVAKSGRRGKAFVMRLIKDSMLEEGLYYHRRRFPIRFKNPFTYKFARRNAVYNRNKRRLFGHSQPLKFSGELERETTRYANVIVRQARATRIIQLIIRLRGTRKLNRFPQRDQLFEEIRQISEQDENIMGTRVQKRTMKGVRDYRARHRKRFG